MQDLFYVFQVLKYCLKVMKRITTAWVVFVQSDWALWRHLRRRICRRSCERRRTAACDSGSWCIVRSSDGSRWYMLERRKRELPRGLLSNERAFARWIAAGPRTCWATATCSSRISASRCGCRASGDLRRRLIRAAKIASGSVFSAYRQFRPFKLIYAFRAATAVTEGSAPPRSDSEPAVGNESRGNQLYFSIPFR